MTSPPSSSLARNLALAYTALIIYACLHPLSGWRFSGLPLLDYLFAPWPKYFIPQDFIFNLLGYLPFGFFTAAALSTRSAVRAAILTVVLALLLSLSLETAQNLLPSRVASNTDLLSNVLGGLLGALPGAWYGRHWFAHGGMIQRLRTTWFIRGRSGDAGLILLALWLLGQFSVKDLLFSSGNLRSLLGIAAPLPFSAERFIAFDTILAASSIVAVGLFAHCMMRTRRPLPVLLLLLCGAGAKTLATATFFQGGSPLAWLTPGTSRGILIGSAVLGLALLLPRLIQHAIAGTALLGSTVLANIMPDNPYLPYHLKLSSLSNILNFHGLTEFVDSLWPFAALAYLSALGLWRGEHLRPADSQKRQGL